MPLLALLLAAWALWVLESARSGVQITQFRDGPTPITEYSTENGTANSTGAQGPVVVVAHGFAGSREMMQGYALPLAQAGYRVFAFDFEGHGSHDLPMSGDVDSLDGTTRLLVEQTLSVIQTVGDGSPVALLGHSMATDILVRVAAQSDRVGPLVLLSAFSQAIDGAHPTSMALITGAWEPGLREFALEAAQMVDPAAQAGQTARNGAVLRRAVIAPLADHVSILHARTGRAEAVRWFNSYYGRDVQPDIPQTGWALLALLAAITLLAAPLARLLPAHKVPATPLSLRGFALLTLPAMIAAPLLAAPIDTRFLPVLVADYLALHLAIFGAIQLLVLTRLKPRLPHPALLGTAVLLLWALAVFGLALDRYGASFVPNMPRLGIIAALALGALPFMIADAWAAHGAPLWQRIALRLALLVSLGIAVALDFEGLFFLIMIAPVIVLFFLTFGVMGRSFAARHGPATAGLALGLVLAWALGVSFPLFAA